MLNLAIRMDGAVELITRSALVNHGAGLRKDREFVYADPVYYANRLYSKQSGRWPVRLKITGPHFRHEELPTLPAVESASYLDAVALLSDDGKELNLLVTNRHPSEALKTSITIDGFTAQPKVLVRDVTGPGFMSGNSFQKPENVVIKVKTIEPPAKGLSYSFPPSSLTCLTFEVRK
jgi:alpha-N-arabinofuranosidase